MMMISASAFLRSYLFMIGALCALSSLTSMALFSSFHQIHKTPSTPQSLVASSAASGPSAVVPDVQWLLSSAPASARSYCWSSLPFSLLETLVAFLPASVSPPNKEQAPTTTPEYERHSGPTDARAPLKTAERVMPKAMMQKLKKRTYFPASEASTNLTERLSSTAIWPAPWFDAQRSTEENYRLSNRGYHVGFDAAKVLERSRYAPIRKQLDYSYHSVYTAERQVFQDDLVQSSMEKAQPSACGGGGQSSEDVQWIVFTAGVMGAGKTYSLEWLKRHGRFPLHEFVSVDPDQLRRLLPEFDVYLAQGAAVQAGERTRKEAGLLAELLTTVALQQGRNVVVDGSLRDAAWYSKYFEQLRQEHAGLRIAILHITAPAHASRLVQNRAKVTGRVVPEKLLQQVMEQVPASVQILRKKVDVFVELYNGDGADDEIELVSTTPKLSSWDEFASLWKCPTETRSSVLT